MSMLIITGAERFSGPVQAHPGHIERERTGSGDFNARGKVDEVLVRCASRQQRTVKVWCPLTVPKPSPLSLGRTGAANPEPPNFACGFVTNS